MRVLDLFSGIGGFSLGLNRAGMRTVAFCEIDPYCRRVLKKHWPDVPIYDDVRTLTAERLVRDGIAVDLICGGFPCQDISVAGKGAGLAGERSGLWSEYARIIGEVRPPYVIVENVAALLGRGLLRILGDLTALGYDSEWHAIPACAVGAPHRRDRLWIVGFPNGDGWHARESAAAAMGYGHSLVATGGDVSDAFSDALRDERRRRNGARGAGAAEFGHDGETRALANANEKRSHRRGTCGERGPESANGGADVAVAEVNGCREGRQERSIGLGEGIRQRPFPDAHGEPSQRLAITWGECGHWLVEPDVGRVAHGIPARVDRLRGLGNAVVPQIPELIGRAIMGACP